MTDTPDVKSSAIISDDGRYRYTLTREWGQGPRICWIMLNPSTADVEHDDPTIRRCIGYAKREGCGSMVVVNLFAFRTTWPKELWAAGIGAPEAANWCYVAEAISESPVVVAAWGALQRWRASSSQTWQNIQARRFDVELQCLGKTKDGSPRHPLYCRADVPLQRWLP